MPSRCDSVCCLVSSYLEEHAAWRSVKSCSISLATKRKAGASTTPLLPSLGKSRHPNMTTRRRHPFHDAYLNSPCRQLPALLHAGIDMYAENTHPHPRQLGNPASPARPIHAGPTRKCPRKGAAIPLPSRRYGSNDFKAGCSLRSPSLGGADLPT